MSSVDHALYVYHVEPGEELKENFNSEGNMGAGLSLLKHLRDNQALHVTAVAHYVAKKTQEKASAIQLSVSETLHQGMLGISNLVTHYVLIQLSHN